MGKTVDLYQATPDPGGFCFVREKNGDQEENLLFKVNNLVVYIVWTDYFSQHELLISWCCANRV